MITEKDLPELGREYQQLAGGRIVKAVYVECVSGKNSRNETADKILISEDGFNYYRFDLSEWIPLQ